MDPMHGAYLHKQSHTMSEGDMSAEFQIRQLPQGFIFEKKGQRDVYFDWTEWMDTGIHTMRLEFPYPKTGGPGGNGGSPGAGNRGGGGGKAAGGGAGCCAISAPGAALPASANPSPARTARRVNLLMAKTDPKPAVSPPGARMPTG
jgi:hypothetical protein